MLEGESCCSAPYKWCFIFDEDHWWKLFFLAIAVFGEVQASSFCGRRSIRWSPSVIFRGRRSIWWSWIVMCRGRRDIWWDWKVLLLVPRINNVHIWRASFMRVMFRGRRNIWAESFYSAHCKWYFIRDGHYACVSFGVPGAIFGEVGGWYLLFHAL